MAFDLYNFISSINFDALMNVVVALYHDFLNLVIVFKGSSTAFITKGSGGIYG